MTDVYGMGGPNVLKVSEATAVEHEPGSMHWTTELYALIDAGDPRAFEMFSPDISVKVGNHPETRGIEAMMGGELGHHAAVSPSCTHAFVDVWDLSEDMAALHAIVTYNRIDGQPITVPVLTIIRRNSDKLIDKLHLFLDNRPLFEGLSE